MKKFNISLIDKGKRLDKFLSEKLKKHSRSVWQKAIEQNCVSVNRELRAPHSRLKDGDVVSVDLNKLEGLKEIKIVSSDLGLDIVFENNDFLIVNKPAGVIVHPTKSHQENTLVNALIKHLPEIREVGDNELRPGIVHRLDKDASGLLVIAKNQETFDHLKKQFQERKIEKEYFVLVHGKVKELKGVIQVPIARSGKGIKMAALYGKDIKEAITEFEVVKHYFDPDLKQEYTLLKVRIKTGRTHQIRVHCKSIGHPVVGDQIYKIKRLKQPAGFNRIFLHAAKLGFFDLRNKWQEFKIDLPKELKDFFKELKEV